MKTIQNSRVLSACTVATFLAGALCAQDANEPKVELEELTLKGTDTAKMEYTASNSVSQEFIEQKQPEDLAALFDNSLSVHVNGGSMQAQQVFINNLESTLANVTIDGAVQPNVYHHSSSLLIEPEMLKSVEVTAGPGSALDGAGALAGALRFETKNAFDLLDEGKQFGGTSKVTGYDNGDGYKLSQSLYGEVAEGWGVLVSGSYTDRDPIEDGDGEEILNSDYQRESVLAKLTGKIDEAQTVELSYEYFQDDYNAYYKPNLDYNNYKGGAFLGDTIYDMQTERDTVSLSYDLNPVDNDFLELETNVYYTEQKFERKDTFSEGAEIESVGVDVRNTSKFDLLAVTYGFDYRDDDASAYGDPTWNWGDPSVQDVNMSLSEETQVFGLYAQTFVPVTEYAEFSFGARFDDYDYEDAYGTDFESDEISPNASLTIKPIQHLSITGGYAEAYRGVSTREAIFIGSSPWGADANGEKSEMWKLSFNYDNGTFFAGGSVFDQKIKDYLSTNGNSWTGEDSNGDIKNDGYDLRVGLLHNGFYGSVGVSYAEPELDGYDYDDDFGMVVAGRRWVGDFGYVATQTDGSRFWSIGWMIEYRESVDEELLPGGVPGDFPSIAEKDSYVLHNFNCVLDLPAIEGLTLALNVDNVFDQTYQDHTIFTANGYNSAGRSIRLSASYEF